ncbi:MAG TPA: hypothetical protein VFH78_09940 [Candidatus Thermoplasmatota archaeon]|nr:hypothetical protein [Candidatus Thermoplasmatota archaeon]
MLLALLLAGCTDAGTAQEEPSEVGADPEPEPPKPQRREVREVRGVIPPHVYKVDVGERVSEGFVTFDQAPEKVQLFLEIENGPNVVYFFKVYIDEQEFEGPMTDRPTWDILLAESAHKYGVRVAPWVVDDGFTWRATFTAMYNDSASG